MTAEEILERGDYLAHFNPNHDKLGRFAKSSSGSRVSKKKQAVKDYQNAYDRYADRSDRLSEAEYRNEKYYNDVVKKAFKNTGKFYLQRVLNNIKNHDLESVQYYDKVYEKYADRSDQISEAQYRNEKYYNDVVKKAYKKTGKIWLERVLNNIRYSTPPLYAD